MSVAHLHSHRRVLQNNMHISLTEIATKLYEALNFAGNINKGKTEAIGTVSKKYIYIYIFWTYTRWTLNKLFNFQKHNLM